MQAILYDIDEPLNKVFKTLEGGFSLDIKLKNVSDVNSFQVVLSNDKPVFNYVHFVELGYYFVSRVEVINNRLNRYYLEVDVLMTYSDLILNSESKFRRSIREGDYLDVGLIRSVTSVNSKYPSDYVPVEESILLVTVGGE